MNRRLPALLCVLLLSLVCLGEEAAGHLRGNLREMRSRGISMVPLPKRLHFQAPAYPAKLHLVATPRQPYYAIIVEELSSRLEELGCDMKLTVSGEPRPDSYNVVVKDSMTKPSGLPKLADGCEAQLYGLTPVAQGIELAGMTNALYAAVTFRHLLALERGRLVVHQAQVVDWPDFPIRAVSLNESFTRRHVWNPAHYETYIKPVVQRLLRLKINEIRGLPRMPFARTTTDRLKSTQPFLDAKSLDSMRRLCRLSAARGINCGMFFTYFCLGNKLDEADPDFQGMHRAWNGTLHSWARTDLYALKCSKYQKFLRDSEWNLLFTHAVDTGGSRDPEGWSLRDEATRKRFGDDRAAADAAVFMEHYKAMAGTKVKKMIAVVYPYTGYCLDKGRVMSSMKLPQTSQGEALAMASIRRDRGYLDRLHQLMPLKDVAFCLREAPSQIMRKYMDCLPGRVVDIYYEAMNSWRDILPMVPPEMLNTGVAFYPERRGETHLWLSDGGNFQEGYRVAFAERSWNSRGEYYTELDRSRNPVNYEPAALRFLARRTAEGIWGVELGARLYPVFDHMLSFSYATDPFRLRGFYQGELDLEGILKRNERQLQVALSAFESVWKERKQVAFPPGSYAEFVELYRMLQVAPVFNQTHLSILAMNRAAGKGNLEEVERLYTQALSAVRAGAARHGKRKAELDAEPWTIKPSDLLGWDRIGPARLASNLIDPDFSKLEQELTVARDNAAKIFATANIPDFLETIHRRARVIRVVPEQSEAPQVIRHWYEYKHMYLRPNPAMATLRRTAAGLRIDARIHAPGIGQAKKTFLPKGGFPAGDSFEILIHPEGAPYYKYHFVTNAFGQCYSARHGGKSWDVFTVYDSGVTAQTTRTDDEWTLRMELPYTLFGKARPGKGWTCLLALNDRDGSFSSSYVKGTSFHHDSFWQTLSFETRAPAPETGLDDVCSDLNLEQMEETLHTSGSGTALRFKPSFRTAIPVTVKTWTLTILDEGGKAVASPLALLEDTFVPACYQRFEPYQMQLEFAHKRLQFQFDMVFTVDGKTYEKRQTILRGEGRSETPDGIHRWPFETGVELTPAKGRLAFDFKPNWSRRSVTHGHPGSLMLMHVGPRNKTFNYGGTVTLRYDRMWRRAYLRAVTEDYESRNMDVPLKLAEGKWHRLEVAWDFTQGRNYMSIACDGKTLPGTVRNGKDKVSQAPLAFPKEPIPFKAYLGSANNGMWFAEGLVRFPCQEGK